MLIGNFTFEAIALALFAHCAVHLVFLQLRPCLAHLFTPLVFALYFESRNEIHYVPRHLLVLLSFHLDFA
jgi:hypothetical protein